MRAIDISGVAWGAGVGVADEAAIWQDEKAGRVAAFKTWSDYLRIGGVLAGLAGQAFGFQANHAKSLTNAMTPLLTKTIVSYIRSRSGTTTAMATSRSMNATPVSRHVSRTYDTVFQPVGVI